MCDRRKIDERAQDNLIEYYSVSQKLGEDFRLSVFVRFNICNRFRAVIYDYNQYDTTRTEIYQQRKSLSVKNFVRVDVLLNENCVRTLY